MSRMSRLPPPKGYLLLYTETHDMTRNELRIHADCFQLSDVRLSDRAEKTCVDRAISILVLEDHYGHDGIKEEERAHMAEELVRQAPRHQDQLCALVPQIELDEMRRRLERETKFARLWKKCAKRLFEAHMTEEDIDGD